MTPYFARVDSGLVVEVRLVTADRIAAHPDLYPGEWVAVPEMAQYPAPGWTWDGEGFAPIPQPEIEGSEWDGEGVAPISQPEIEDAP
jgi:hypothetical protein